MVRDTPIQWIYILVIGLLYFVCKKYIIIEVLNEDEQSSKIIFSVLDRRNGVLKIDTEAQKTKINGKIEEEKSNYLKVRLFYLKCTKII